MSASSASSFPSLRKDISFNQAQAPNSCCPRVYGRHCCVQWRLACAVVDDVASCKRIPFAQPPVGELRWGAPQPIKPWEGIREVYAFVPDCVQALGIEKIATIPSEDCLYLPAANRVWEIEARNCVLSDTSTPKGSLPGMQKRLGIRFDSEASGVSVSSIYCDTFSSATCVSSGRLLLLTLSVSWGSGAVTPNSLRNFSTGSRLFASSGSRPSCR